MADGTNRVAGTVFLSIDGQRVALAGEFAYQVSGVTREPKVGADGYHGVKEKFATGNITGKLRDGGGVSLVGLSGLVNATVIAELINGKTVTGRNMFWSGDPAKADAEEGEIEFKMEGPDVRDDQ
jgi:hypothetical protein